MLVVLMGTVTVFVLPTGTIGPGPADQVIGGLRLTVCSKAQGPHVCGHEITKLVPCNWMLKSIDDWVPVVQVMTCVQLLLLPQPSVAV